MLDPGSVARLRLAVVALGGGYLRNPVRQDRVTCATCVTPVDGFDRCFTCNSHRTHSGLGDAVAFLTYAVAGKESGYVMRGYKARPPVAEHRMMVGLLLILALHEHTQCIATLLRHPVSHWAIVPSLPTRSAEHPLRSLVRGHAQGTEIMLGAAAQCERPRDVDPAHYSCPEALPARSHVMVIDDTWTSGGHAQSAALALRKAGAAKVSVLVVARWLRAEFANSKQFIDQLADQDYEPGICPWTGGSCP